ncbi:MULTISPECIES: tRNA 2-thiouridine(34) synthase MnmA [Breznakia]|uniref:tRNA-specific 2-thiouridylase MnmA n=1 Tax=Breznakia blatticola TaxID=1754012 RepID=A0A4R7ZHU3_9FIRM|nr:MULTISPECIES: tRNA 2-thiouridine(34) synthase MnmA [Breznakia]MDH6367719.1 tRNA-specific 2-thiouridylase [Breznakia sp. PH1-1]MDH6404807.1 tRNA-specific 2-thiouridylase [Breznakia sp. PF1-11]MDH6412486.1 tRNA-specific 2-thiouridylase [Breznakia sp. PFB1-11]MDH6414846.1 tRNA-specific 2-thiouridylase [Breznakia sp. PFB1-14]MDH6417157.1 tRNA-specific 2-thiouridylase [Breznakia sp. PFB1-4]
MKDLKNAKILVGLSGGVDSAVAAYLLKEQGYDITCAFMRNWDAYANNDIAGNPTIQNDICPQEEDYNDAKKVADKLGLELLRVDFVEEYWNQVFTYFIDEYKKGRTPNPDILCNKYIKFDSFMKFAKANGFDYVATGHYARVVHNDDESVMLRGTDSNKDQTYFLCQVSQDALAKALFPIGDIDKPRVREIAKELDLNVATKKDSTGICFIGERNFREFLTNYIPAKNGRIIDIDTGNDLGEHVGVLYYTIGQRKGLGIGGEGGPWFVVGKDVETNELYVAAKEDNPWLLSTSCRVSGVNWFSRKKRPETCKATAKFRYRQKDNDVEIKIISDDEVMVYYPQGVAAVTPGQEAVFYDGEICLGGGVIEEVYNHENKDVHQAIKEKVNEFRKDKSI